MEDKQLTESAPSTIQISIENMELENEPSISEVNKDKTSGAQDSLTSSHSPSLQKTVLDGWTKEEKLQLHLGIKYKGSKNIKGIQENLPTKSYEEIKDVISYYKTRVNDNPECTRRKLKIRKNKSKPLIPLASWAKVLTDNFDYNELQTELVRAFRLIADLENTYPAICTDQIDFRQIYHQIADAMEGKAQPENRLIFEVLNSCILETALLTKQFINPSIFRNIVSSVNFNEKPLAVPKVSQVGEQRILRHLASQNNYNPLGIPEHNLYSASTPQK